MPLEKIEMKASRSKSIYMCVNWRENSATVRIQEIEVDKVDEFKCLGPKCSK